MVARDRPPGGDRGASRRAPELRRQRPSSARRSGGAWRLRQERPHPSPSPTRREAGTPRQDEPAARHRRTWGRPRRPADGTIGAIATDHAPTGLDKRVPYAGEANGVMGWDGAPDPELVQGCRSRSGRWSSPRPAGSGLPGGTRPARPAGVTLVDPGAEWTVEAAKFQSKSRNTPYEGRKVTGRVVRTVVGGRTVWPLEERR